MVMFKRFRNKKTVLLAAAVSASLFFTTGNLQAGMKEVFSHPDKEYRPLPLWHLNGHLTPEIIEEQMTRAVRESGFGGFCLLPVRSTTPTYLTGEYFERYGQMLQTARRLGMKIVFYDDIDFPTGSAGDKMAQAFPHDTVKQLNKIERLVTGPASLEERAPEGTLMAVVAMNTETLERIDLTGNVANGKLFWSAPKGTWKLMYFTCVPSGRNLVDFLDPGSVQKFLSLTYDECYRRFSEYFGETIFMSFFDDVAFPQTGGNGGYRMWTPSYNDAFIEKYGYSPTSYYPALWYDIGPETASARIALHRVRADMLAENWVKPIADWAAEHRIVSIGHPMDNYNPQAVNCSGDNLKFYEHMDYPLMDSIHYYGQGRDGFKQIGSAAYNYDKPVTVVEIYGNYPDASVDAAMLYRSGMELFIRGANFFLPHGLWLDEKSVYIPPEISWRNPRLGPALPHYNTWAARISMMLQGGRHVADIGILYPIASLQANYRMDEPQKMGSRFGLYTYPECDFQELSRYLVEEVRRDFTFVHPEVLDGKCEVRGDTLHLANRVNYEDYKIFMIPGGNTIHWSNLQKIQQFYESGGTVIASTQLPSFSAEPGHDGDVQKAILSIFGGDALSQPSKTSTQHHLKIEVSGKTIQTYLDGTLIDTTQDESFSAGGIGFRQATRERARFDNLKVTAADGSILFRDDFSHGLDQWDNLDANTSIEEGKLHLFENQLLLAKEGKEWKDYTIECDFDAGNSIAGITFRAADTRNSYMWQISTHTRTLAPHKKVDGTWQKLKSVQFGDSALDAAARVTPYTRMSHPGGGKAFFMPQPTVATLRQILDSALSEPDVSFPADLKAGSPGGMGMLSYLHKVKENRHLWFVANSTDQPITAPITLAGKHTPEIWDPSNGEVSQIGFSHFEKDGSIFTEVRLILPPVSALFLVSTTADE
jgi:hypothetical protein